MVAGWLASDVLFFDAGQSGTLCDRPQWQSSKAIDIFKQWSKHLAGMESEDGPIGCVCKRSRRRTAALFDECGWHRPPEARSAGHGLRDRSCLVAQRQLLAFSWRRPSGNYDLYIMEVASRSIREITRDSGRNERPSWAPDGRHIVFESTRGGSRQIWVMLADGSEARQL